MTSVFPSAVGFLPDKEYILGSASPRRRALLTGLDIEFKSISIPVDELVARSTPPNEIPTILAKRKSKAHGNLSSRQLLITADTVVISKGKVINKPNDEMEAKDMLMALSGREHTVVTGVHLRSPDKEVGFHSKTQVRFDTLSEAEIDYYVQHYAPFDKAGGYGIQEWIGYIGITGIDGCYYNVMGLPLHKLYRMLCTF